MLDVARHFFTVGRGQAVHRPDRAVQDQPPAPAPRRRPGLADRDRELAAAGHARRADGGRRRRGRLLHAGRVRDIVAYAAARYITIVPEIDMPGHTNAALASYAELNCDGQARRRCTPASRSASARCASTRRSPTSSSTTWSARSPRSRPGRTSTSAATRRHADHGRRLHEVHRARAGDRRGARQADDRLGGDRARRSSTPATIAQHWDTPPRSARSPPQAARGQQGDHVAREARRTWT